MSTRPVPPSRGAPRSRRCAPACQRRRDTRPARRPDWFGKITPDGLPTNGIGFDGFRDASGWAASARATTCRRGSETGPCRWAANSFSQWAIAAWCRFLASAGSRLPSETVLASPATRFRHLSATGRAMRVPFIPARPAGGGLEGRKSVWMDCAIGKACGGSYGLVPCTGRRHKTATFQKRQPHQGDGLALRERIELAHALIKSKG